jgi:hypothetical protein
MTALEGFHGFLLTLGSDPMKTNILLSSPHLHLGFGPHVYWGVPKNPQICHVQIVGVPPPNLGVLGEC